MAFADHIFVKRFGYTHHGIDLGDGRVIHYTGEVGQKSNARVSESSIEDFAAGVQFRVRKYGKCDDPEAVVERARQRLHENRYSLLFNNCEHFATWCKTGKHRCEQLESAKSTAGSTAFASSAVIGSVGVISATGAAAGLSAAGVMSGLATVGGVVGGGAVAGLVAVGAAPAALATLGMSRVLKNDPTLDESEREARRAGRWASIAGAAAGSFGSVGAVSTFGSAVGLSGAGIASGLASVGSLVGGGMAAGVAVSAAVPAVVSAAVGYGAYRAWVIVSLRKHGSMDDGEADRKP